MAIVAPPCLSASAPSAWINPTRHPVTVRVDVATETTLQLEVSRRGSLVHRGAPASVPGGQAALIWNGRGASADGLYEVTVRDLGSGQPAAPPMVLRVDVHAPRLRIVVPAIAIPRSSAAAALVRIADVERSGIMVRPQIPSANGRLRPLGPWRAWSGPTDTAAILATLRSTRAIGPMSVVLQARDAAGNLSVSAPAWVDPHNGPTPRLVIARRVATAKAWVALTFDDGYAPSAIGSILGTLERLHSRATFCLNAVNAPRWSPELRRRISMAVSQGRLGICNHGHSHRTGRSTSSDFDLRDLTANVTWDRIAGVSSIPVYRPPGGDYGPTLMAAAHTLGYRYLLLWSIDTRDWSGVPTSRIVDQVVGDARAGDIVLQHAIPSSAAALPQIIAGLRRRGLEPVRVNDLLAAGTPSV